MSGRAGALACCWGLCSAGVVLMRSVRASWCRLHESTSIYNAVHKAGVRSRCTGISIDAFSRARARRRVWRAQHGSSCDAACSDECSWTAIPDAFRALAPPRLAVHHVVAHGRSAEKASRGRCVAAGGDGDAGDSEERLMSIRHRYGTSRRALRRPPPRSRAFRKAAANLGRNCFSAEVASFTEA